MIPEYEEFGSCQRCIVHRRAFTLLELLVVVAIITLLVGILFPVIEQAKSAALSITCSANLKQLQVGWQMFLDSNKQTIPKTKASGSPNWAQGMSRIYPNAPYLYGTNAISFNACPAVQKRYDKTFYDSNHWGYTVNVWWRHDPNDLANSYNDFKKWTDIRHPAGYPWFMDPEMYAWGQGYTGAHRAPLNIPPLSHLGVGPNHGNDQAANVAYADSSVRLVPIIEVDDNATPPSDYGWFENR